MHQMNPLIGPRLHQTTLLMIAREWGSVPEDMKEYVQKITNVTPTE